MIRRALPVFLFAAAMVALIYVYEDPERTVPQVPAKAQEVLSADDFLLDTFCTINIYEGGNEEVLEDARRLLRHYDELFSPEGEGSDIYRINSREEDSIRIEKDTAELFMSIGSVYESAGGDLEPAIEPLTELWNVKERTVPPSEAEIKEAASRVSHGGWHIEEDAQGAFYFHADDRELKVDVGAFAKGFIADRLKERLMESGVSSGIINLGGNVLCIGSRPDGSDFVIGIRYPDKEASGYIMSLDISDGSVVTAGRYERFFEYEGRTYHHIIDPKTGWPSESGLLSVTVTGQSSVICDALATTLFIKGRDEGLSYLEAYNSSNAADYEAYFIDEEMNITYSEDEADR